jgi:hypothetical protein
MQGEKGGKDNVGPCRFASFLPGLLEFTVILCYLRLICAGGLPVHIRETMVYLQCRTFRNERYLQ